MSIRMFASIKIPSYKSGSKTTTKRGVTQIERARIIKRTLGTVVAARYMKARGWSIEAALSILAGV